MRQRCDTCNDKRYITFVKQTLACAKLCPDCAEGQCPECGGTEFQFVRDEKGYRYALPCPSCMPLRQRLARFNEARLPGRYHEASFLNFHTDDTSGSGMKVGNLIDLKTRLFKMATRFAPGDQGFLLYGIPGSGKTHLLSAFIRYLTLEKGIGARFIEFSHLLSEIREQYDHGKGDTSVILPLVEAEVLAIDELGKGVNNEWQLSVLDELISKRYNQGKTTLFTTNYALHVPEISSYERSDRALRETLVERVGDRIFSRLFEMTSFVKVDAPDYRKRAWQESMTVF